MMRKLLFSLIVLMVIPIGIYHLEAKSSRPIKRIVKTYKSQDESFSMKLPGLLVRAIPIWNEELKSLRKIKSKVQKVRVCVAEASDNQDEFRKTFEELVSEPQYHLISQIVEGGEKVDIVIGYDEKKPDFIREFIVNVGGEENVFIYVKGKFSLEDIARVVNHYNE